MNFEKIEILFLDFSIREKRLDRIFSIQFQKYISWKNLSLE